MKDSTKFYEKLAEFNYSELKRQLTEQGYEVVAAAPAKVSPSFPDQPGPGPRYDRDVTK